MTSENYTKSILLPPVKLRSDIDMFWILFHHTMMDGAQCPFGNHFCYLNSEKWAQSQAPTYSHWNFKKTYLYNSMITSLGKVNSKLMIPTNYSTKSSFSDICGDAKFNTAQHNNGHFKICSPFPLDRKDLEFMEALLIKSFTCQGSIAVALRSRISDFINY